MSDQVKYESRKTPFLLLDQKSGLVELKGSSLMEDTHTFYDPVMEWIYDYVKHPKDTLVNIDLEFFNSASAKILLLMLKTLSKIQKEGHVLTVNWHYDEDDEDIRDSGYDFSTMSKVKFNLVKKKMDTSWAKSPECNYQIIN